MEKAADSQYPIHDLLRARWSPRAYSERAVTPDTLRSLWEAARWAPSSSNEQPWRFIVATRDNPAQFERLFGCLLEGNRRWAHRAPVLMLSVASLRFQEDGTPNRHALHDVGLAVENLIVQATSMDLFVHQMAGFDVEKARKEFHIPEDHDPVAMMTVGYAGDPGVLSDVLREREFRPRQRAPIADFVFSETWGTSSPLATPVVGRPGST